MTIIVALAAAGAFGVADFLGGVAGRKFEQPRRSALTIPTGAQLYGLAGAIVVATATTVAGLSSAPTLQAFTIGGIAGVGNAVGVAALYHGLAVGRMSVVAPVSAVVTSTIPVIVGVVLGERPTVTVWTGVVLAVAASGVVARVGRATGERHRGAATGWRHGLLAGLGLAFALTVLAQAHIPDPTWVIVGLKTSGSIALVVPAVLTGASIGVPSRVRPHVMATGVLDAFALGAFLWTTTRQLLVVAAVLVSLYPVGTVLLSRALLGERLATTQVAGVVAAFVGIALMAAG